MTPIEKASEAYNKARWNGQGKTKGAGKSLEAMRAALLALAEAEISDETKMAGAIESTVDQEDWPAKSRIVSRPFRAMLRHIADEGNDEQG